MSDEYLPILLEMQKDISETKANVETLLINSEKQDKKIEKLEGFKNRLYGIVIGLSAATGTGIGFIVDAFKNH